MKRMLHVSLIGVVLAMSGCGKSGELLPLDADEIAQAATEAASTIAASFDPPTIAYRMRRSDSNSPDVFERIFSWFVPTLSAAACNAGGSTISACPALPPFLRTRTYDCSVGDTAVTLVGKVDFNFSNAGCSLIGFTNRSVTRTVEVAAAGKKGGTLTVSSSPMTDYRGVSIGGGSTLTVNAVAANYTYDIKGVNRIMKTSGGASIFQIATRTTTPITVSGTSLANLKLNGGSIEIIHSGQSYVATLSLSDVAFSSTCGCPISGSMSGTLSGSVTGTATVTFTGCGTASISVGGASTQITADSCSSL